MARKTSILLRSLALVLIVILSLGLSNVKTQAASGTGLKASKKSVSVKMGKVVKVKITNSGTTQEKATVKTSKTGIVDWKISDKWKNGTVYLKIEGKKVGSTVLTVSCGSEKVSIKVKVKKNAAWTYDEIKEMSSLMDTFDEHIDKAYMIFQNYTTNAMCESGVKELMSAYDILLAMEKTAKSKNKVVTTNDSTFLNDIQIVIEDFEDVLPYGLGESTVDKWANTSLSLSTALIKMDKIGIKAGIVIMLETFISEGGKQEDIQVDYGSKLKKMADKGVIGYTDGYVTLGSWDMEYYSKNDFRFFTEGKKRKIEWEVLDCSDDGKSVLLISKYILIHKAFNEDNTKLTWENSTLRKWLNNQFINSAFTETERALIKSVTITNEKNSKYNIDGGKNTTDKIFLLSISEAEKYYGNRVDDSVRMDIKGTTNQWWLRTPGSGKYRTSYINSYGGVYSQGWTSDTNVYGVVPVMWINLSE